jgi:nucleoid-associated protein YgaU
LESEFLAGADHAQRDFTAIGYQDFLNHEFPPVGAASSTRFDEEQG